MEDLKWQTILKEYKIDKIADNDLGQALTEPELGTVLQGMKHNKTPGIDGITSEFLKVFWVKLKSVITRALNSCFQKGKLSTTLRKGIITCIPKGQKDRCLLKNWRPLSLLCVTYKLASGVITKRLKTVLEKVISKTQRGFIPGRQISDCTRLIYDIMYSIDHQNSSGLLMLIDFEKAFDSISWHFLYDVLDFFGFSNKFIKWIKLFNNDFPSLCITMWIPINPNRYQPRLQTRRPDFIIFVSLRSSSSYAFDFN